MTTVQDATAMDVAAVREAQVDELLALAHAGDTPAARAAYDVVAATHRALLRLVDLEDAAEAEGLLTLRRTCGLCRDLATADHAADPEHLAAVVAGGRWVADVDDVRVGDAAADVRVGDGDAGSVESAEPAGPARRRGLRGRVGVWLRLDSGHAGACYRASVVTALCLVAAGWPPLVAAAEVWTGWPWPPSGVAGWLLLAVAPLLLVAIGVAEHAVVHRDLAARADAHAAIETELLATRPRGPAVRS